MSLSAHEQQVPDSIEDGIVRSDPKLASLLATFARLTAEDELAVRERIRADHVQAVRKLRRWRRLRSRAGTSRPARRLRDHGGCGRSACG